ncbi:hypothetical protein SCHPADRAFT_131601 [Schizopora paradoxa]|uniref:Uncharacterized protein n=1 Tax=Schizopora paradoxa TaxID=27342 RepID=A0A0H2S1E7_9AGAM|nr:hypothetical protein SCHPADRAFT_131601 [Schizopora paradoxa]
MHSVLIVVRWHLVKVFGSIGGWNIGLRDDTHTPMFRFLKRKATKPSLPSPTASSSCDDSGAENLALVKGSTAVNVAKVTLSLMECAGEAIPVVGDPLKAVMGGFIKVLDSFDTKSKNKRLASRLLRKLRDLEMRIEQAKTFGNYDGMRVHVEELLRCAY